LEFTQLPHTSPPRVDSAFARERGFAREGRWVFDCYNRVVRRTRPQTEERMAGGMPLCLRVDDLHSDRQCPWNRAETVIALSSPEPWNWHAREMHVHLLLRSIRHT
jgi:hypothetical protein